VRIVVMGAGGVGGYFGARLARSGESVTMVARGAHLRAIQAHGLRVRSTLEGEYVVKPAAVEDLDGVARADVVLLCVKAFDTDRALERIRPVVGADTAVLTLQNGVDGIERIDAALGPGHALGGAAYVFATIEAPGVIAHRFAGRVVFGEPDGSASPRVEGVREALARAGVPVEVSSHIQRVLWEKYLFICAQAGMTALCRANTGVVRGHAATWTMYRRILEELHALSARAAVGLAPDIVDAIMKTAGALAPETTASLHHDLLAGRRLELEALHGHAVRLGERLGVPTPMLFAVYAALLPHVNGAAALDERTPDRSAAASAEGGRG
jgi:2-dehydropantoate 2-reductase